MLRRDSQRPIEEMSEFMERRAGFREVDGFLAVVGGSNAAHVQMLAEFADVVEVDTVRPTCRVYQHHRRGRSPHGEGAGQNCVKEHGSVPAGDDLICSVRLAAELKLLPD